MCFVILQDGPTKLPGRLFLWVCNPFLSFWFHWMISFHENWHIFNCNYKVDVVILSFNTTCNWCRRLNAVVISEFHSYFYGTWEYLVDVIKWLQGQRILLVIDTLLPTYLLTLSIMILTYCFTRWRFIHIHQNWTSWSVRTNYTSKIAITWCFVFCIMCNVYCFVI